MSNIHTNFQNLGSVIVNSHASATIDFDTSEFNEVQLGLLTAFPSSSSTTGGQATLYYGFGAPNSGTANWWFINSSETSSVTWDNGAVLSLNLPHTSSSVPTQSLTTVNLPLATEPNWARVVLYNADASYIMTLTIFADAL